MWSVFVFVFILYLYLYLLVEEGSDVSLCCDPCGLVLPPSLHGPSLFSWLDGPVRRGLPPLNLSHNKYLSTNLFQYFQYLNGHDGWGLLTINPSHIKCFVTNSGREPPRMKSGQCGTILEFNVFGFMPSLGDIPDLCWQPREKVHFQN